MEARLPAAFGIGIATGAGLRIILLYEFHHPLARLAIDRAVIERLGHAAMFGPAKWNVFGNETGVRTEAAMMDQRRRPDVRNKKGDLADRKAGHGD